MYPLPPKEFVNKYSHLYEDYVKIIANGRIVNWKLCDKLMQEKVIPTLNKQRSFKLKTSLEQLVTWGSADYMKFISEVMDQCSAQL